VARAVTKRSTSPPGGMGARPELRSAPRRAIHRRLFLNAWWRRISWAVVQPVHRLPVRAWDQVPVGVDGELDRRVAELVADIRERLALGDEEARERVPEVVEAHASELGLLEDLVEHAVAEVVSVEGAPVFCAEQPVWHPSPAVLERLGLPGAPKLPKRLD
jgi:hypothetical protein